MHLKKRLPMAVLCGIIILNACSKKGSSSSGGGTGDGSFSVTIDGKTISGTDKMNNADLIIAADPTSNFDSAGDIFLTMHAQGDTIGVHLPDRTGFTDVGGAGLAISYGVITLPDTFYLFTGVQFNVTSLTKTRIVGTFSGTANTSLLPGGKAITLTNGSFNLPRIN
ncbi:MAG: hypothetical protein Q8927_14085 [Bacteroidota bacterium]|nr:hypothetical protein [Bacteroidota bacterium]MDP4217327.1 hypothetical protein [Bacteroidota bacterium]MDP4245067.1 hypothetical protein [Bacteroidota bacterium]MDP4256025.1 hypothetical protein [Bacteroidota bacterium]MDP4257299.1 hypothetical protein [Bacteroidota bacterium]